MNLNSRKRKRLMHFPFKKKKKLKRPKETKEIKALNQCNKIFDAKI